MKVRELISMLENCNQDSEVLLLTSNSSYVCSIGRVRENANVRSFWGKDFKGTIVMCNEQIGSI